MPNNKTIYLFGNPLLPFDSLPLKLEAKLKKEFPEIDFQAIDPSENLKPINKELLIIDTIEGIDEVKIFSDIDKIKTEKIYSLHDFDLGLNLKLLYKLGELKKITIFGLPAGGDERKIFEKLVKLIKHFL